MRGLIEDSRQSLSFSARRELIALASRNNMNTYFYAPKDDSYHRRRWRELYLEEELSQLADLVKFTDDVCGFSLLHSSRSFNVLFIRGRFRVP